MSMIMIVLMLAEEKQIQSLGKEWIEQTWWNSVTITGAIYSGGPADVDEFGISLLDVDELWRRWWWWWSFGDGPEWFGDGFAWPSNRGDLVELDLLDAARSCRCKLSRCDHNEWSGVCEEAPCILTFNVEIGELLLVDAAAAAEAAAAR